MAAPTRARDNSATAESRTLLEGPAAVIHIDVGNKMNGPAAAVDKDDENNNARPTISPTSKREFIDGSTA